MNTTSKVTGLALAALVLAGIGFSQMKKSNSGEMPAMDHSTMAGANNSESTKAYEAAMAGMMKAMNVPLTGKPDLDFVQGMMPHHQGAIDMAQVVLQFGKDVEVKALAQGVIKAQEAEIVFMKEWLSKTNQSVLAAVSESNNANKQAMTIMMQNMMVPYTGNADVDFFKGMIPHHQGAVDMAKVALQFAKDPALLNLANDVVTAQSGEISFMTDWLKKNGN